MTDKELIILAAKAAGIEGGWDISYASFITRRNEWGEAQTSWNPLRNSDANLDLLTKLSLARKLMFRMDETGMVVWYDYDGVWVPCITDHDKANPIDAFRRSVVHAAARLGELMK